MQPTRWFRFTLLALVCAGAIYACRLPAVANAAGPEATYQYSTINALLQGYYDGALTLGELARHGSVGLGTTNGLDGELIMLDGAFYRARTDGTVDRLPDSTRTPFAIVSPFKADRQIELPAGLDINDLYRLIDASIDNRNLYQTVRIDGRFASITVRSVPAQTPPYRPLVEVVKQQQVVFSYKDVKGTLIGFRAPDFLAGINVPGYHFHFISDDRRQGGHLLGITTGEGSIGIDQIAAFEVQLPESAGFAALSLSGGRKEELDAAEKQHR